ncbi:hypothetical protein SARI_03246 [Salmonella enterica subsp. arizonae serovar 62:z4,z23:-]|uniref:Uncharacterized protein n=1 Tax=Salmonella arizonae (strain ATCC BAA-731 / CDC346-86 / RSK2980) TaxID=41514 RepID=A9MFL7_SALAR|nr:hypothetical protein SARI_03246 [Salmonella enterica subsp. arizonae serovar 62:z4,z23:-]
MFRQHSRSLAPQLGNGAFELTRGFYRRFGIANATASDKDMNRDAFEQRQIFQRQAAGHGHFKAHIRQAFDRGDIRLAPRHACGLRIAATVINDLPNARFAPLLRLFPGPVACQFDLHVAIELFRHIQRAFRGIDIGAANDCYPVCIGFETHTGEDFTGIGNFSVRQHDFMRIERFQVANGTYTFANAQNSAHFDNIHLFGNQAGGFIGAIHGLVIQRDLQHR